MARPPKSFRPLTGILFFNNKPLAERLIKSHFSVSVPLRGFCFSTYTRDKGFIVPGRGVSVPLRGFCFSTEVIDPTKDEKNPLFPSPYGDFVFQQSLRKALSFLT